MNFCTFLVHYLVYFFCIFVFILLYYFVHLHIFDLFTFYIFRFLYCIFVLLSTNIYQGKLLVVKMYLARNLVLILICVIIFFFLIPCVKDVHIVWEHFNYQVINSLQSGWGLFDFVCCIIYT